MPSLKTILPLGRVFLLALLAAVLLVHPSAQALQRLPDDEARPLASVVVAASDTGTAGPRGTTVASRGTARDTPTGAKAPTSTREDYRISAVRKGEVPGGDGKVADTPAVTRFLEGCSGEKPRGSAENGKLPADWLCDVGQSGKLRADAAEAYAEMDAAYREDSGKSLVLTDTYRPYAAQVDVRERKPHLAAVPGTSLHGLGIAIDFGGGAASASGPMYGWLVENAGDFGWENPDWAKGSKYEPWHWEYVPARES